MTYKIAHIADIHWRGFKRHDEYKKIMEEFFATCKAAKIDAFVISGDIVHSKTQNITPELIEMLTWWFTGMVQIAPVHVTLGNHDGLLTNLTRQDTVTPIINAINSDKISVYKKSGVYSILNDTCDLVVFSPFDEETWPEVKNTNLTRQFSIAVFHGAVNGCLSDTEWELNSDADLGFFAGYDFVMLGDIHKRQDLDQEGRIAYPGSMIQQNFGEDRDKGFLLWNIESKNKWSKEFIPLQSIQPYVTIDWKGDLETSIQSSNLTADYLKNARVRIKSEIPLTQVETREVAKALKANYQSYEAYFKYESIRKETNKDAEYVALTDRDPRSLLKMIANFGYTDLNTENQKLNEKILEIINDASKKVSNRDLAGGKTWSLGRMEWDNTFGYGENNFVDFTNMSGLIGIFGQNRIGKSSIPATILYSLFNTSDRGLSKNTDIVNVRKDYCRSKIDFHVGADRFFVDRQTIKKTNKKGEVSASTHLNLSQIDQDDNNIIQSDMNGEQRRDTDKELRALIGDADDFVMTAFATQGDGNSFITAKPTLRQEILARFLQLDFFNDMYEIFRDASSGIRRSMSDAQDKISKANPVKIANEIKTLKDERDELKQKIANVRSELENAMSLVKPGMKDQLEAFKKKEQLESFLEAISVELVTLQKRLQTTQTKIVDIKSAITTNRERRSNIDVKFLLGLEQTHKELTLTHEKLLASLEIKESRYTELKKSVDLLTKVPCGDSFPSCRFIKDSHKSKQLLPEIIDEIKAIKSNIKTIKKSITNIDFEEVCSKLNEAKKLDIDNLELEKQLITQEMTYETILSSLNNTTVKQQKAHADHQILVARWDFDSLDKQDNKSDPTIALAKIIDSLENKEQKCSELIGSKTQELRHLKELSDTIKDLRLVHDAYEVLMKSFSKSGIPSHLVTHALPVINKKLLEILFEDCGFAIELESDEGSKKLDIYIDYGDSKRKIECSSGMERMIASLALRTALHSITHLPKPDFMIIDEGFGALDDSNVEVALKMLRSMLDYYRFILIISHVETVKESVDEMIEVTRCGLNSQVHHE
jgi:DNA repair exonuclease SbcCD nuclease subunit